MEEAIIAQRRGKPLVVVESPFAGKTEEETARNDRYLSACLRDSVLRGESPYASHALLTRPGVLRDGIPDERKLGIECGYAWWLAADLVAFYVDLGMSPGMRKALARLVDARSAQTGEVHVWTAGQGEGSRTAEGLPAWAERQLGGEWTEIGKGG